MTAELEEKLARFRGFLASDPVNASLLSEVVALSIGLRRPEDAEKDIAAALVQSPGAPEIVFQSGVLKLAQRKYAEASALFEALLTSGLNHPAIRYNAAYALVHVGEVRKALGHLEFLTPEQRTEHVPEADKLEARCLHYLDDLDRAISLLERHLERQPEDVEAWGLLALVAIDNDLGEMAKKAGGRALTLDSKNEEALLALGSMDLDQHESKAAQIHFREIVDRNPVHGRAWSGLAFAQTIDMQLDAAEESFSKAVEYMPNHIGTWQGLAWLQILRKDWPAAEKSLAAAMSINRNVADTHGTLAVVAISTGRLQEAELMIRRSLGFDVNCASGLYAQSLLAAKRQQPHLSMDELLERIATSTDKTGSKTLKDLIRETAGKRNSLGAKKP